MKKTTVAKKRDEIYKFNFKDLPFDMQAYIISFLEYDDILSYAMTCRSAAAQLNIIFYLLQSRADRIRRGIEKIDDYLNPFIRLEKKINKTDAAYKKVRQLESNHNYLFFNKTIIQFAYDSLTSRFPTQYSDAMINEIEQMKRELPQDLKIPPIIINKALSLSLKISKFLAPAFFVYYLFDFFLNINAGRARPGAFWPLDAFLTLTYVFVLAAAAAYVSNYIYLNYQINTINNYLQISFNEKVSKSIEPDPKKSQSLVNAYEQRNAFFQAYAKMKVAQQVDEEMTIESLPRTVDTYLKGLQKK